MVAAVVSGVPQGTVQGPFFFIVNDLPANITSGIKVFADDCVLHRPFNSGGDHFALQRDLDQLEKGSSIWQMNFLLQNVLLCPLL